MKREKNKRNEKKTTEETNLLSKEAYEAPIPINKYIGMAFECCIFVWIKIVYDR